MSTITVNNHTHKVTISSIGTPGPRGPMGDVTPEAQAILETVLEARNDAVLAAVKTGEDHAATAADRQAAAASATAAAAAAALTFYGVSIYKTDGIESGGYHAERRTVVTSSQTELFAEILDGSDRSEAIFALIVDEILHGPWIVRRGTPEMITGFSIPVSANATVSFLVIPVGEIRELYIRTKGSLE